MRGGGAFVCVCVLGCMSQVIRRSLLDSLIWGIICSPGLLCAEQEQQHSCLPSVSHSCIHTEVSFTLNIQLSSMDALQLLSVQPASFCLKCLYVHFFCIINVSKCFVQYMHALCRRVRFVLAAFAAHILSCVCHLRVSELLKAHNS